MLESAICPKCDQPAYCHNGTQPVPRIACANCGVIFGHTQVSDWQAADETLAWYRNFRGNLAVYWGKDYEVYAPHIEAYCLDSLAGQGMGYQVTEYDADRQPQHAFCIFVWKE